MSEWKNQDFSQLTVLELRKVAKAMGVQLGAGISKAGIVEKLDRARNAKYSDIPAVPMDFTPIPKSDDKQESPVEKAEVPAAVKDEKPSESPAPANKQPVPSAAKPETAAPAVAAPAVAAPAGAASKPEAEKPAAPAQPASDARPAISGFRPAYQAPATPPRFGSKPAYQASSNSFGNRPARPQGNDFARPARPVNYTRFGPAAQADSTNDRSYDAPRTASSWADRRPTYGNDLPDRRSAYGSDVPDRRPAYGSDLPDRRPAYGTDAPRSAFGTDAPRYSRSYDAPSAFDSGRARQPAFNSPQRDVPSDLQSMWAGSPSDMLSPAECQDGSGILELHPDGYGFLRGASLTPSNRDIYVSMAQVRRFYLRTGDFVTGKVRPQRDGDKYSAMLYITEVNGCPADSVANRPAFDALTPCYPHEHITLEVEGGSNEFLDMRLIDLVAPIGFGQRGLIHCPPAVDKAHLLFSIANATSICHPDAVVMTLLLGGTPEDATLYRDHTHGEVIASTFDQTPENHLRITDMVLERAERLVEMKKNVILLVDSLTYLSKVYTTAAVQQGRQTIGMVNPVSLQKAKKLFGAARCLREGGSLTIFAVMNIETGSRVDDSIAEDLKGTANMELVLDTAAARAGIYPPVNLLLSGTKRAELIASKEQLDGIKLIHEMLGSLRAVDMIPQLLSMLEKTSNNEDLLVRIKDWAALMKQ
ncbi:MAG: transcription termination factor Rho [Christensenellaceae bacterium]|nr:transcription termination factor Rho [Christensenellaceae bacterium]